MYSIRYMNAVCSAGQSSLFNRFRMYGVRIAKSILLGIIIGLVCEGELVELCNLEVL